MLFVVTGRDRAGAGELRAAERPAHLEHLRGLGGAVRLAGPLLDEAGVMIGSLLVLEMADRAELNRVLAADPFVRAGLYAEVRVDPFRQVLPAG